MSFVDPGKGVLSSIASHVSSLSPVVQDVLKLIGVNIEALPPPETQEDPESMYYGEAWAYRVLDAVLRSPSWNRTLLIYTYDEHGGYYDHVPPPAAVPPDGIAPKLKPNDPPGGYNINGPRVPAIVVSPYSKPGGVTNVVHDHTSILATIEEKWNLRPLTNRDATAATVMDFLDLTAPPRLDPPQIQAPSQTGAIRTNQDKPLVQLSPEGSVSGPQPSSSRSGPAATLQSPRTYRNGERTVRSYWLRSSSLYQKTSV